MVAFPKGKRLERRESYDLLKVPRVREGDFHPRILPYRKRAFLELSENILSL
jgi:transposase-like protein